MELNTLKKQRGQKAVRRVGRGGTRGKTSGRGTKGAGARAGNKSRPEWRDTIKKLPKRRGYGKNRARGVVPTVPVMAINLNTLSTHFKDGGIVSQTTLVQAGLIQKVSGKMPPLKILSTGTLDKKLTVQGIPVSVGAKAAIEKKGGTVTAA